MSPLDIVLAALAGGLAEALPFDGPAHLFLAGLFGFRPGPATQVAVLAGTLIALLIFQWRQMGSLGYGLYRTLCGKYHPGAQLIGLMIVAVLPGVLADWLVGPLLTPHDLLIVGAVLAVSGVAMLFIDRTSMTVQRLEHWRMLGALTVGVSQAVAGIPGLGRTGMTVLASRVLGFERLEALRLSLLLAVPSLIYMVAARSVRLIAEDGGMTAQAATTGLMTIPVILVGLGTTAWWLGRGGGFTPFAVWRLLAGGGLVYLSTLV